MYLLFSHFTFLFRKWGASCECSGPEGGRGVLSESEEGEGCLVRPHYRTRKEKKRKERKRKEKKWITLQISHVGRNHSALPGCTRPCLLGVCVWCGCPIESALCTLLNANHSHSHSHSHPSISCSQLLVLFSTSVSISLENLFPMEYCTSKWKHIIHILSLFYSITL